MSERSAVRILESEFPDQENWSWSWVSKESVAALVRRLWDATHPVAFDTETTSLDFNEARLVAMSFAWWEPTDKGPKAFAHTLCFEDTDQDHLRHLEDLEPLIAWLEAGHATKIGANLKYDLNVLKMHDIDLNGIVGDVMIASQMVDDALHEHNLDAIALRRLGLTKIRTEQLIGKGASFTGWGPVPREQLALYANEDVVAVLLTEPHYHRRIVEGGMEAVYRLEMEALPAVAGMEEYGLEVDVAYIQELDKDFRARADVAYQAAQAEAAEAREAIARAKQKAFEIIDEQWRKYPRGQAPEALKLRRAQLRTAARAAQGPLNLSSPAQLAEFLYDKMQLHRELGLRHPPKTKKGNPATDGDVLAELAPHSAFVRALIDWREVSKLISTYTSTLPSLVSPYSHRLHPHFNQCGAGTGRMSCSRPNIQNIPIRTAEGKLIRKAFRAPPGHVLLAADYSQIELRLVADLSECGLWIDAFKRGEDIHQATADRVSALKGATIPRALAKTINFGALYGAGAGKIAATAKISIVEAQDLLDLYWSAIPEVRAFLDKQIALARETGYVWTSLGRRRSIPDIHHRWGGPRKGAENQAGNHPVQGGAADLIKAAMVRCHGLVMGKFIGHAAMIAQIHDELLFEVREDHVEELKPAVIEAMTAQSLRHVPLVVEVGVGPTWADAH